MWLLVKSNSFWKDQHFNSINCEKGSFWLHCGAWQSGGGVVYSPVHLNKLSTKIPQNTIFLSAYYCDIHTLVWSETALSMLTENFILQYFKASFLSCCLFSKGSSRAWIIRKTDMDTVPDQGMPVPPAMSMPLHRPENCCYNYRSSFRWESKLLGKCFETLGYHSNYTSIPTGDYGQTNCYLREL